ncbi:MAG: hypothetical protein H0W25_19150 [Acidimicrobiia bacterium]|nr:hypothetical protein [Acidimicrobiia bacterium]MDQ3500919.1 hypothetical protein [Actinomycetota bacterium]
MAFDVDRSGRFLDVEVVIDNHGPRLARAALLRFTLDNGALLSDDETCEDTDVPDAVVCNAGGIDNPTIDPTDAVFEARFRVELALDVPSRLYVEVIQREFDSVIAGPAPENNIRFILLP